MLRRVNKLRKPLSSFSPSSKLASQDASSIFSWALPASLRTSRAKAGMAAVFLVVVPVFFQAPLVRSLPWLSLTLTGTWLLTGIILSTRLVTRSAGDLITGFTWTWLAGSIYWGWLRTEPLWHLPVEAIGLPLVVFLLSQNKSRVGGYFFLGSLFGTALTDLYIYWADLLPMWRQVMIADPEWVPVVLQEAAASLKNFTDIFHGALMAIILLVVGVVPLQSKQPCWWAFSGAVLSTLIVDLLFFASALYI